MINARGVVAGLCLLLAASTGVVHADGVQLITSPEHDATALDRTLVRAMFSGRLRQWPDGTPVRAFVMPDNSAAHVRFCREVLGTYPYLLRNVWDRLVFTGTGIAPGIVHSEVEMRDKVRATRGAIGYLSPATGAATESRETTR